MKKKRNAKEIVDFLTDNNGENDIISEIFDYLEFDCKSRCFVDPDVLDGAIRSFYETGSKDTLISIVKMIQDGKKSADADDNAFFLDIKNYVLDHLNENIALEQLADKFHVSYYYLSHLFKKNQGQSLLQFRTVKRLEKAVRMLLESDDNISKIATACGFDNSSYFSETFVKYTGETPSDFRSKYSSRTMHSFFDFDDMLLASKMPTMHFTDSLETEEIDGIREHIKVHMPGDKFGFFLHEAAIIEYNGVMYASWYTCREKELIGYTPIIGRRSRDGGKTWSEPEIIAEDKSGKILYCPPVYGICDGKLYMLMNQMVSADHIHSLDLYVLNNETDTFEFVWSRPIPFKLNTNVITLPNGKLMLPGRIAKLDGFPTTPAVLISDSGKINDEWRVVKVAENGILPDGETLVHPETTVIYCEGKLYMFCRNDHRHVPLVYLSDDLGETWSKPIGHDIPYANSKIYCGQLSDGRYYLIANTDNFERSKLVLYISEKNRLRFTKQTVLANCKKTDEIVTCHYPAAVESNGKLNIIATVRYYGKSKYNGRGAVLFQIDI